jgi:hypothetical protein
MQIYKRFKSCGSNGLQPRNQGIGHLIFAIPAERSWMNETRALGDQLPRTAQSVFRGPALIALLRQEQNLLLSSSAMPRFRQVTP